MDFITKDLELWSKPVPDSAEYKNSGTKVDVLGIRVGIGNRPIVREISKLYELSNIPLPGELAVLLATRDLYSIVHGINIVKMSGKAKLKQVSYEATMNLPDQAQTVGMLPETRFHEVFKVGVNYECALSAGGSFSTDMPENWVSMLSQNAIDLGGNFKVNVSSDASFVGKFTYSVQIPIVQATGISSSGCTWVLTPDSGEKPLYGDQLLLQLVAVPKGTKEISYTAEVIAEGQSGRIWKEDQVNRVSEELSVPLIEV